MALVSPVLQVLAGTRPIGQLRVALLVRHRDLELELLALLATFVARHKGIIALLLRVVLAKLPGDVKHAWDDNQAAIPLAILSAGVTPALSNGAGDGFRH